jgi:hypothetical protein
MARMVLVRIDSLVSVAIITAAMAARIRALESLVI